MIDVMFAAVYLCGRLATLGYRPDILYIQGGPDTRAEVVGFVGGEHRVHVRIIPAPGRVEFTVIMAEPDAVNALSGLEHGLDEAVRGLRS